MSAERENDLALVRRPRSAIEKAEPGTKRILSGMVADTHALAKRQLRKILASRIILLDDNRSFSLIPFEICQFIRDRNETTVQFVDAAKACQELSRTNPDLLIIITGEATPSGVCERIIRSLLDRKVSYPIAVMSSSEGTETWVRERAGQGLKLSFLRTHPFEETLRNVLEAYSTSPHIGTETSGGITHQPSLAVAREPHTAENGQINMPYAELPKMTAVLNLTGL